MKRSLPGIDRVHDEPEWLNRYPVAREKIVGVVQAEHLGEMDYREVDDRVEAIGLTEQSYLWSRGHPLLIDAAVAAVKKYGWSRAQVSAPERPGIKGGRQQVWWGVGVIALPHRCEVWHCLDVPAYGLGRFLGHYWTNQATIERWNTDLFVSPALTMTELTGVLMTEDLATITRELREAPEAPEA